MKKPIQVYLLMCFFSTALLIAGLGDDIFELCRRQRRRMDTFLIKEGCLYQRQSDSEEAKQVMGIAGSQEVSRFDTYKSHIIGLITQWVDDRNGKLSGLWFEIKSMESGNTEKVDIEEELAQKEHGKKPSEVTTVGPFTISSDGTEIVSLEKRPAEECTEFVIRKKRNEGWMIQTRKKFPAVAAEELSNYKALGYFPQENMVHVFGNNNKVKILDIPKR